MHKCVGNVREVCLNLEFLDSATGQGVYYLNSSKHRKLIELTLSENDFKKRSVMSTSCSAQYKKRKSCDTDGQSGWMQS